MLQPNSTILDIGGGRKQEHANYFRSHGHNVKIVDFFDNADYRGDFNTLDINEKFDAVWCSHCLEHQLNVNLFLKKIANTVKQKGIIAITVPPLKPLIVGGHLSLWNAGLVVYNLVLAGIDCSTCAIKTYDYNISVIAENNKFEMPNLIYDRGDLISLQEFLPKFKKEKYGHFNGDIDEWNW
jgi:SAM-dependent methyltransferase